MKKVVCIGLVLIMLFALVGCNGREMEERIESLEQALKNQQETNESLQELIDRQEENNALLQELLNEQKEVIESQQDLLKEQEDRIELMEGKLFNLMGKPIEYTEEAPIYGPREGDIMFFKAEGDMVSAKKNYEKFLNYYHNEFKSLMPDCQIPILTPNELIEVSNFYLYVQNENNENVEPLLYVSTSVIDPTIGSYYSYEGNVLFGGGHSASFEYYAPELPEQLKGLKSYSPGIAFGKEESSKANEFYFNIYVKNICVGTCYVTTYAYISARWFKNYVKDNVLFEV